MAKAKEIKHPSEPNPLMALLLLNLFGQNPDGLVIKETAGFIQPDIFNHVSTAERDNIRVLRVNVVYLPLLVETVELRVRLIRGQNKVIFLLNQKINEKIQNLVGDGFGVFVQNSRLCYVVVLLDLLLPNIARASL